MELSQKSYLNKNLHKDWQTPKVHSSHRGTELKIWLNQHHEVNNYLILDDDPNILEEQLPHFDKTNLISGMKYDNFLKAVNILNSFVNGL